MNAANRIQKHLTIPSGVGAIILVFCFQPTLLAEQTTAVSVPFVRCESGGQTGTVAPPKGSSRSVEVDTKSAHDLDVGVLAPPGATEISGPAVVLHRRLASSIGRFDVAEVIARVFPAYKKFVAGVMFDRPPDSIRYGPYGPDTLTYKSSSMVEYKTPAQTEGLGSHYPSLLRKNGSPIQGVAILIGPAQKPDLLLLSVRLSPHLTSLTPVIIRQTEHDATSSPPWRRLK